MSYDQKKIGNEFENEFCDLLAKSGYWVHFISPSRTGAQPFDVIAFKGGRAYAFDCKTSARSEFRLSRLQENQMLSFEKWMKAALRVPQIAVKHKGTIWIVDYTTLAAEKKVRLKDGENGVSRWSAD